MDDIKGIDHQPVGAVRHDTGITVTLDRLPYYRGVRLASGTKLYARPSASVDEVVPLRGLLDEVRSHFTRDDDLPDDLLPRIDAALDHPLPQ